jgi:hypothetical protein
LFNTEILVGKAHPAMLLLGVGRSGESVTTWEDLSSSSGSIVRSRRWETSSAGSPHSVGSSKGSRGRPRSTPLGFNYQNDCYDDDWVV